MSNIRPISGAVGALVGQRRHHGAGEGRGRARKPSRRLWLAFTPAERVHIGRAVEEAGKLIERVGVGGQYSHMWE